MVTQTPKKTLDAPSITPLSGTLLDAASISEGIGWLEPEGLFASYNCLVTDREATWPCPDVFLDPPVQAAASTETTGGTVAADTYFSTITALSPSGETLESNEISQVTTGATSTITFNWAAVPNATGYRIYATSGASGSETFLVEVASTETDYVWTGTPAIGTDEPPTVNTAIESPAKTFENPDWMDGIRFAVYAGLTCKYPGYSFAEGLAEAERVFKAKESVGVERAVMETLLQGATDLTPAAGAVAPEVGLAILEGHAATTYAGVPTIHAPRSIGSLLMTRTAAHSEGGVFYSEQGAKVASGGGYNATNLSPAGAAPAAGTLWMYASGEVAIARGEIVAKEALNQTTNDDLTLVERPYVVALDCYKSAVRVTVA
jgi:hypothetical protein